MRDKFKNRDGSLTAYALACGYLEITYLKRETSPDRWEYAAVELSREGCYHVKAGPMAGRWELWEGFDTLTEARQAKRREVAKRKREGWKLGTREGYQAALRAHYFPGVGAA